MLCINLKRYSAQCSTTVGGVSRAWIFDPNDFNFEETFDSDGDSLGYQSINLRVGTGAVLGTVVLNGTAVSSVPVTTAGTGYPYATIPLTFTGGGGSGAAGYATVVSGAVISVTITAGGTGYTTPPTAALSTSGATVAGGARMYPFEFLEDTGEYTFDNPLTENCSISWTHTMVGTMINISRELNNYLDRLNEAGCCCGLGVIMELNSNKVLIMGEKYVNGSAIRRFKIKMSSAGGSGKMFDNDNKADVTFTGKYVRALRVIGTDNPVGMVEAFV